MYLPSRTFEIQIQARPLTNWLTNCLTNWLTNWLTNCLNNMLCYRL